MGDEAWMAASAARRQLGTDGYLRCLGGLIAERCPSDLQKVLAWGGYSSLWDLRRASDEDLLRLYMFGPGKLRRLRDHLAVTHPDRLPSWVGEE